jgi:capsid protein
VDPLKEAQAFEVGLKNNIITHSDIYASQGKDWEEAFYQRQRERTLQKELGIEEEEKNGKKEQAKVEDEETEAQPKE